MQPSLQKNGDYVQRRKMYPVGHRHNLRSNVDLYWLRSQQTEAPDLSKVLKHKIQIGNREGRENYKKYINKKSQQSYPKESLPAEYLNQQEYVSQSYSPPQKNMKTIDVNINRKDDTLSRELQNFKNNNSSIFSSRYQSIQPVPKKLNLNSHEMKQQNLRSSLDKPVINENPQIMGSQRGLRNADQDKLQNFLRVGLKKSTRYY